MDLSNVPGWAWVALACYLAFIAALLFIGSKLARLRESDGAKRRDPLPDEARRQPSTSRVVRLYR